MEKALGRSGQNDLGTRADFDNLTPKIASYHSAKGLTFDCVLLPRLCESAFRKFRGEARRRLLFVGVARATQWVYLSTIQSNKIDEFGDLKEAARNSHLVVQWGNMMDLFNQPEQVAAAQDDDDDYIL